MKAILLVLILGLTGCGTPWFQHDCTYDEWLVRSDCK